MLNKDDRTRYARLLRLVLPYKRVAIFAGLATLIYALTEPLAPFVIKDLIDNGFTDKNMSSVYGMVAILVVGFSIRGVATVASSYCTTWVAQKIVLQVRCQMFKKLLCLPMPFFNSNTHGSILSRFSYDVNQLMSAATGVVIILIRDGATIIALLAYLFWLNWHLTLILLVAAPFLSFIIVFISRYIRRMAHSLQADMSSMNHTVDEALFARQVIRIYGGQNHENKRFQKQAESIFSHSLKSTKISAMASPFTQLVVIVALSAIIVIAAHKAKIDPASMTTGNFVSFLGAMALLFSPIKRLGQVNEPLQRGLAAAQSVFTFLDEPVEDAKLLPPTKIEKGSIIFKDICFKYADDWVLDNFNLEIEAGKTVALVGESGSGKSTLANLLAGFYHENSGSIIIDGQNTNEISLSDRRKSMAYVAQDTVLFSGTIVDNIAYAEDNPDMLRVIEAAKHANAHDFIEALPETYETDIGQQGGRLSGGQKQRIAIARALYKDTPILILDEATSALDNRSEQKVQEAIETLSKNRTSIIIAHRLSTIRNADRIVILNRGKIMESGTHDELVSQNGFYAKLLSRVIE